MPQGSKDATSWIPNAEKKTQFGSKESDYELSATDKLQLQLLETPTLSGLRSPVLESTPSSSVSTGLFSKARSLSTAGKSEAATNQALEPKEENMEIQKAGREKKTMESNVSFSLPEKGTSRGVVGNKKPKKKKNRNFLSVETNLKQELSNHKKYKQFCQLWKQSVQQNRAEIDAFHELVRLLAGQSLAQTPVRVIGPALLCEVQEKVLKNVDQLDMELLVRYWMEAVLAARSDLHKFCEHQSSVRTLMSDFAKMECRTDREKQQAATTRIAYAGIEALRGKIDFV